jgi:hypothetical protein
MAGAEHRFCAETGKERLPHLYFAKLRSFVRLWLMVSG